MGTVINHSGSDTQCFISDGVASGQTGGEGWDVYPCFIVRIIIAAAVYLYGGFILYTICLPREWDVLSQLSVIN